ncbi:MAG: hypothetical protein ACK5G7_05850 [Erysipelotrichaceae bacterium]
MKCLLDDTLQEILVPPYKTNITMPLSFGMVIGMRFVVCLIMCQN